MIEPGSQRALFDIPEDVAYFNTAFNAPLLETSRRALIDGAQQKCWPWRRTASDFFAEAEEIRNLAARLFGGDRDSYAVTPSATYGLCTAARAIEPQLGSGDRIVVMEEEFPASVLPWRRVARGTGASVVTVGKPSDGDWTSAILERLAKGARIAALSGCHWTNGAQIDLMAIARECRRCEIILVLDLTQSLGVTPMNLDEMRPDFAVAAGYKWLLWPYGLGLMYVGKTWWDARPLEESWLARERASDFASLVDYSDIYAPGARRFDVSEVCVPTLLPGAIAALRQLETWTINRVAGALQAINREIADGLEPLGFELTPEAHRSAHILAARAPGGLAANLINGLREEQIYVSQRADWMRISPHLHISPRDVERLLGALRRFRQTLPEDASSVLR